MIPLDVSLLYPMVALFLWTFVVLVRNVHVRVAAVLRGDLDNAFFELFQGAVPDDRVVKTGNHLRNLCELPPLFYVVAILIVMLGKVDAASVALAWAYVASRIAHSLVHLTVNRVPPRFACFAVSNLVLLALWVRLLWSVHGQSS